jgi:type I restriction enzyme M protein
MTIKKSDLYRSLWASCDELRGGMDASQYKDYILTLLFVKYVSDRYENDKNALIEVPVGGSFSDIADLKGKPNIGEGIDKVIARLAEANDLQGVINVAYFNDDEKLGKGKEMVDRLSKLVTIFNNLDFRSNRPGGDDLLGDAYEYLMRHFATESGKSKGQFYTPAEVSRVLAKVVGIGPNTKPSQSVYDPTCGSGSLLLKAADEAPHGISVYGQEKDVATWALAKMNMILHGYETAEIGKGDTLTSPWFTKGSNLKLNDFVVANPPFSTKSWSNGLNPGADEFGRFEYGIPPAKNGDYAFLLHAIKSLKSTGKAAVILPHGVLFRGNTEGAIRKNLLKHGLIKAVIGLPPNLFYGTGIPACIVIVDKEGAAARTSVFVIDASTGFIKDGAKNRLRSRDIHRIVDTFNSQTEIAGYSRLVPLSEISSAVNDYSLNLPRYIDSSPPEDLQDLEAHLRGGIPNHDLQLLSDYWDAFPSLRQQLFTEDRAGYSKANVAPVDVQRVIDTNDEVSAYRLSISHKLSSWYLTHHDLLTNIKEGANPKPLVEELSEDLLIDFSNTSLLSRYDIYEQFMVYWGETMQDDLYLISTEGWSAAAKPRAPIVDKERSIAEEPDLVLGSGKSAGKYKMDLIPPALIVARCFQSERQRVDELRASLDRASQQLVEFVEEHGTEGGLIEDILSEKGKATKAAAVAQIRALASDPERADELAATKTCLKLIDAEAAAKTELKKSQYELDAKTLAYYAKLNEADIKSLVIDDKWIGAVRSAVQLQIGYLCQELGSRFVLLDERYLVPLAAIEAALANVSRRVEDHLARMGVSI